MRPVVLTREQARALDAIAHDEGGLRVSSGPNSLVYAATDTHLYVIERSGHLERRRIVRAVA